MQGVRQARTRNDRFDRVGKAETHTVVPALQGPGPLILATTSHILSPASSQENAMPSPPMKAIVQSSSEPALGVNRSKFEVTAVVSTSSVDRRGIVIDSESLDTSAYRTNPAVLWCSSDDAIRGRLPIGKAVSIRRDGPRIGDRRLHLRDAQFRAHQGFDDDPMRREPAHRPKLSRIPRRFVPRLSFAGDSVSRLVNRGGCLLARDSPGGRSSL